MELVRIFLVSCLSTILYGAIFAASPLGSTCSNFAERATCSKLAGAECIPTQLDKPPVCQCAKDYVEYVTRGGRKRCAPTKALKLGGWTTLCGDNEDCAYSFGQNALCWEWNAPVLAKEKGHCKCAMGFKDYCGRLGQKADTCELDDCRHPTSAPCSHSISGSQCDPGSGHCVCPPNRPFYWRGHCYYWIPDIPCKKPQDCPFLSTGSWQCVDGGCTCKSLPEATQILVSLYDPDFGYRWGCKPPTPQFCPGPHICYGGDPCRHHRHCGKGGYCKNRECTCPEPYKPTLGGCIIRYGGCCSKDADCNASGNMFVCTDGSCACAPPKIWNAQKQTCTERVCFPITITDVIKAR